MSHGSITELHYIAPLANLESIFDKGILSHNEAEPFKKADVSMESVQNIRATKEIPEGVMGAARKIHDCANVYFNAKNPMLSKRRTEKDTICVLRLKPELLDLPNAVVSDRNAATKKASFYKAAEGVNKLAKVLFADFWRSNYNAKEVNEENGQLRCAELLLPHKIHPSYIGGMYVASEQVKQEVLEKFPEGVPVEVTVHPQFFFEKAKAPTIPPLANAKYPQPVAEDPIPEAPKKERVIVDLTKEHTSPKRGIEKFLVTRGCGNKEVPYEPKIALPEHITIVKGNLLDSKAAALVNTVNCKGVMGAGIAKQFKSHFKAMFSDYEERCKENKVKPGVPYIYKTDEGKIIVNFPTKDNWRYKSKLEWIDKGLLLLKQNYQEWGITSLAIPPLGCGKGGLDWAIVRKKIIDTFKDVTIPIEIYSP